MPTYEELLWALAFGNRRSIAERIRGRAEQRPPDDMWRMQEQIADAALVEYRERNPDYDRRYFHTGAI